MCPILGITASQLTSHTSALPVTANLHRWYDAATASSITSSAGLVSQWNDLSGNAGHLVQATSTYQPVTGTTTQNGKNVLVCVTSKMIASISISASTMTVFTVFNKASAGTGNHTYSRWSSFWPTGGDDYSTASGLMSYAIAGNLGGGFSPSLGIYRGSADTASQSYSYGSYAAAARINGTATKTWYNSATATGTTSGTAMNAQKFTAFGSADQIAANGDGFINGWFDEIFIYNAALSDSDVSLVLSYLKTKWSVS
jgi:hypothetical protein